MRSPWLAGTLDALQQAVFVFAADGRCCHVNRDAEALVGRAGADLLGQPPAAILPDAHAVELVEDAMRHGRIRLGEWRAPRRACRAVPQLLEDGPGAVLFVGGQPRDAGGEWLRPLAEHSPAVFWVRAIGDRSLLYISPVFAEVWGRSAGDEDAATLMLDSVHPDDRPSLMRAIDGPVDQPWSLEYRIRRPDGRERVIRDRGFPIADPDGHVNAIGGWAEDVTDTREAEAALRRVRELNRDALHAARMIGYEWDTRTDVVRFTENATEILGFPDRPLRLHETLLSVHEEDREAHAGRLLQTSAAGGVYKSNYRRFHLQTGELVFIEGHGRAVLDSNGSVIGLRGVLVDVTEKRRAEQALAQKDHLFRALVERSAEFIAIISPALTLDYVSPSLETVLGRTPEMVLGRRAVAFVHADDAADAEARLAALRHRPFATEQFTVRIRHASGAWRHFEVAATNRLEDPDIRGIIANGRDVTERIEAAARLRANQEQLVQAEKQQTLGRITGQIAHDFNNSLTGIIAYAQLVLDQLDAKDPIVEDIKAILSASGHAAGIARQLLTYSGKKVTAPRLVDLNTVLGDSRGMLARLVGEDLALTFELDPGLDLVLADPDQLWQIVMNLALNARDAIRPSSGMITIRTATVLLADNDFARPPGLPAGRYVRLTVADTGMGIDADTQRRIFEPYFTTKPVGQGHGLGLATVLGIVTAAKGTINVSSERGRGTTFDIYLPAVHEGEAESATIQRPLAASGRGKTALVAEDEVVVRSVATRMLQRLGFTVHTAVDGRDAVSVALRLGDTLDLVLTDVIMPELSGPDFVAEVRAAGFDPAIVFFSGYTGDRLPSSVLAPETVFLEKPFHQSDLAERVQTALAASAAKREARLRARLVAAVGDQPQGHRAD